MRVGGWGGERESERERGVGSNGKTVEWGELRERGMREQGRDRVRERGWGGGGGTHRTVLQCCYMYVSM